MSYISAIHQRFKNQVLVWERTPDGRIEQFYNAPYYYYVPDPNGTYTSIYNDKLRKKTFKNSKDFFEGKRSDELAGIAFESDIPPEIRILSNSYYGIPAPQLHLTFYDIEVDYDPAIGFSSVLNPYAPINSIALLHYWSNEVFVLAVPPNDGKNWTPELLMKEMEQQAPDSPIIHKYSIDIQLCVDERDLLQRFLSIIEDSDAICGWNSEMFDTPYIGKRIERTLGPAALKRLDFNHCNPRWRDIMDKEGQKKLNEVLDLQGRIGSDYMILYKKYEPGERPSYRLAAIADTVLVDKDGNPSLPKLEYSGNLHQLYRDNFAFFVRYNIRDTEILGGFEDILGYFALANEMYHMSCGLFSHVAGTIKLAEQAIVNYCHHELRRVVPNWKPTKDDRQIAGAFVLLPRVGEHKWAGSVDINSLYPSAIRSINISPETLRGQFAEYEEAFLRIASSSSQPITFIEEKTDEVLTLPAAEWREILIENKWAVSGYGTVFDQSTTGIIPSILTDWYAKRKHYQKLKKESEAKAAAILKKYTDAIVTSKSLNDRDPSDYTGYSHN